MLQILYIIKNIKTPAAEIFKVKNEISPKIMFDISTQRKDNYCNLRIIILNYVLVLTAYNGAKSISYLGLLNLRYGILFLKSTKNWII